MKRLALARFESAEDDDEQDILDFVAFRRNKPQAGSDDTSLGPREGAEGNGGISQEFIYPKKSSLIKFTSSVPSEPTGHCEEPVKSPTLVYPRKLSIIRFGGQGPESGGSQESYELSISGLKQVFSLVPFVSSPKLSRGPSRPTLRLKIEEDLVVEPTQAPDELVVEPSCHNLSLDYGDDIYGTSGRFIGDGIAIFSQRAGDEESTSPKSIQIRRSLVDVVSKRKSTIKSAFKGAKRKDSSSSRNVRFALDANCEGTDKTIKSKQVRSSSTTLLNRSSENRAERTSLSRESDGPRRPSEFLASAARAASAGKLASVRGNSATVPLRKKAAPVVPRQPSMLHFVPRPKPNFQEGADQWMSKSRKS